MVGVTGWAMFGEPEGFLGTAGKGKSRGSINSHSLRCCRADQARKQEAREPRRHMHTKLQLDTDPIGSRQSLAFFFSKREVIFPGLSFSARDMDSTLRRKRRWQ